jgi:hypothetical protein
VGKNNEPDCSQLPVDHVCEQQHMQQLDGTNEQLADKNKQVTLPREQLAENQEQLDAPNEQLLQGWAKFDLEQATDQSKQLAANHKEQVGRNIRQPGEAVENLLETGKQMIVSFLPK